MRVNKFSVRPPPPTHRYTCEVSLKSYGLKVFEHFYRYAGLRLNIEKTEAIWLGKTNRFGKICNVTITHKPVKVLGIWISKNFEEMIKTNFEERISKLKNLPNIWAQ